MHDTDAYAAAIIQRQLRQLGIEFNGKVMLPQKLQQGQLLAKHLSKQ